VSDRPDSLLNYGWFLPAVKAKSAELQAVPKAAPQQQASRPRSQGIIPFVNNGLGFRLPLSSLLAAAHFFIVSPFLIQIPGLLRP
jgi:hypothetical protein